MEKRVVFYQWTQTGSSWPSEIVSVFTQNFSKYGVAYFEEGSSPELAFRQRVSGSPGVIRQCIWQASAPDLYRHPFHYLTVKEDAEYWRGAVDSYLDLSSSCDGGGQILCRVGARQTRRLVVDASKSKPFDIMTLPGSYRPKIHIVSRRLKELMEARNFSGVSFATCLRKGVSYSSGESELSNAPVVGGSADYYQLLLDVRVRRYARIGQVVRVFTRCSRCGAMFGCFYENAPTFSVADLQPCDFQISDGYDSSNLGSFRTASETVIISSRVIQFLIESKAKGLADYLTDPPIKHGVLELID